jgi:hypothetical protein
LSLYGDTLDMSYIRENIRRILLHCPGGIDQRRSDSRTMGVTDRKWLWVIIDDALIGDVDVVRVLRSTWLSDTPDWRRYILSMTFRLTIGKRGCGRGLKDTK